MAIALGAFVAVTLPACLPHPLATFIAQVTYTERKTSLLPWWLPLRVLEALPFLVAAAAMRLRMSPARVYLVLGATSCLLILPPMTFSISFFVHHHLLLTHETVYLVLPAIFLGLWACRLLEGSAPIEA